jgi:hypothetical protein
MVGKIKEIKDKVLGRMETAMTERGSIDRMDVKEMGELADIIKDLAKAEKSCWEAEYYRSITEAMAGEGGSSRSSGYSGGGRMGYMDDRRGYAMGHTDPISTIRDMLATSTPEMRAKIRNDLSGLMSM